MTADEASQLLRDAGWLSADINRYLPCAVRASRTGVGRVHLIGFEQDGALLRELFTHDGVGTVVTRESLENIREAKPDDIAALIALIEPMEQEDSGASAARAGARTRTFQSCCTTGSLSGAPRSISTRRPRPNWPAWRSVRSTANGATASS
jgi:hypothetical protein